MEPYKINLFCTWTFKNITIMATESLGYPIAVFDFSWDSSSHKVFEV